MNSIKPGEQFVTLFDSHYLPLGLCLYRSLEEHARPFHLWIVAMDDACAEALAQMQLVNATVLRLAELESDALRAVKSDRSVGEYCWTLTPFLPSAVLQRAPQVERVTYLDADLFFFQPPGVLLDELAQSGKHVLITEHAFAPEYAHNIRYGRFCVQFVTFRNTPQAKRVLEWWQARCLEWCYGREEDGKFGDQKYLDDWPSRFRGIVHVLRVPQLALGPWNADRFLVDPALRPVFFHFHGFRVAPGRRLLLYSRYRLGPATQRLYDQYVAAFRDALSECGKRWGEVPGASLRVSARERLRRALLRLKGAIAYASY